VFGEALKFTGGVITKAEAGDKPDYISSGEFIPPEEPPEAPSEFIPYVPVSPVTPTKIYETNIIEEEPEAPNVGDELTISDDGLGLTNTAGGAGQVLSAKTLPDGTVKVTLRFIDVAAAVPDPNPDPNPEP
jgi:hypothetical protein